MYVCVKTSLLIVHILLCVCVCVEGGGGGVFVDISLPTVHINFSRLMCVPVCVCVCVHAEEGADPGDVQAAAEEHRPVHAVHQHQDHPLRAQPAVAPHQPLPHRGLQLQRRLQVRGAGEPLRHRQQGHLRGTDQLRKVSAGSCHLLTYPAFGFFWFIPTVGFQFIPTVGFQFLLTVVFQFMFTVGFSLWSIVGFPYMPTMGFQLMPIVGFQFMPTVGFQLMPTVGF